MTNTLSEPRPDIYVDPSATLRDDGADFYKLYGKDPDQEIPPELHVNYVTAQTWLHDPTVPPPEGSMNITRDLNKLYEERKRTPTRAEHVIEVGSAAMHWASYRAFP